MPWYCNHRSGCEYWVADKVGHSGCSAARRICRECSLKVQMHKSAQNEIARLGGPRNVAPGPECVADVEWFRVAAGLLPETKTRELMKHAAQCGHCGPLLRNATDTLSEEVTSNEERMLASLSSSRQSGKKGWPRPCTAAHRIECCARTRRSAWPGWFLPASQAFALPRWQLSSSPWLGSRVYRPPVEQLLAQAYRSVEPSKCASPGRNMHPCEWNSAKAYRISTSHHLY